MTKSKLRPWRLLCAMLVLPLAACQEATQEPAAATTTESAQAHSVTAVGFGQPVKVSDKSSIVLSRVDVRNSVGIGITATPAETGKAFIVVEYVMKSPGIEAVSTLPPVDLFLIDGKGHRFQPTSRGEQFGLEVDFGDRYMAALEKAGEELRAEIFEVPVSDFDRSTWALETSSGARMALQ